MKLQQRTAPGPATLETRTGDDGDFVISGYFAVFDDPTELYEGIYEKIDKRAFDRSLSHMDVRCLINHESGLVLGRTSAGTLELKADQRGLFGTVKINPNDLDAMNLYQRVKRGDVSQCSFGFVSQKEKREDTTAGGVLFTLEDVDLYEVSVVTFPAYENTGVQARKKQVEEYRREAFEIKKRAAKERMMGRAQTN